MIRKITLAFFYVLLLCVGTNNVSAAIAVGNDTDCAQELFTGADGTTNKVTAPVGTICAQDTANNALNQIYGKDGDIENGTLYGFLTQYHFLLFFCSAPLGLFILWNIIQTARMKKEGKGAHAYIRRTVICSGTLFAVLAITDPSVWIPTAKTVTQIGIYNGNKTARALIRTAEMKILDPKYTETDDIVDATNNHEALILGALSTDITSRKKRMFAYTILGTDFTDDCTFLCNKEDLAFSDFLKRINSCEVTKNFYLVENNLNTKRSYLDVSWTKDNKSIQLLHNDKCDGDFTYNNDTYGYGHSTLTIQYLVLDPTDKSYLTGDFEANIAKLAQIQEKANKYEPGLLGNTYEDLKAETAGIRSQVVNSNRFADYSEFVNEKIVNRVADDIYNHATNIIGSEADFFMDKPDAAKTALAQAMGARRDAYYGKSRAGIDEIQPILLDAKIIAQEILKLECNLPSDMLNRVASQVNSNSMVPYTDSTVKNITDSLTKTPAKCAAFSNKGLVVATSYTEQERSMSMKIIKDKRTLGVSYFLNIDKAYEQASRRLFKEIKSNFKSSQIAAKGMLNGVERIFENKDSGAIATMLADAQSIKPRFSVSAKLDPAQKVNYVDSNIATGNPDTEEGLNADTNDNIRLRDYIDTAAGSLTKNPAVNIGGKISESTSLSVDAYLRYLDQKLAFCTPNLNKAFGLEGGCNIYDFAPQCRMSVQICWGQGDLLAYLFLASLDLTITTAEIATVLKIVSSLADGFLSSAGDMVGAISGTDKTGGIVKMLTLLTQAMIKPVAVFLDFMADFYYTLSLLYFFAFSMCFYLVYISVRKFFTLAMDAFIYPAFWFFKAMWSAAKGDYEAFVDMSFFLANLVAQFQLLGAMIYIVDLFVTILAPVYISGFFEITMQVNKKFDFFTFFTFKIIGYGLLAIILVVTIATAIFLWEKLSISIQSVFKQENYSRDTNVAAVAAMLATGTATASQLSQLTNAIVQGTGIQARQAAARAMAKKRRKSEKGE